VLALTGIAIVPWRGCYGEQVRRFAHNFGSTAGIEQRIENPRVGSSILSLGTIKFLNKIKGEKRTKADWPLAKAHFQGLPKTGEKSHCFPDFSEVSQTCRISDGATAAPQERVQTCFVRGCSKSPSFVLAATNR